MRKDCWGCWWHRPTHLLMLISILQKTPTRSRLKEWWYHTQTNHNKTKLPSCWQWWQPLVFPAEFIDASECNNKFIMLLTDPLPPPQPLTNRFAHLPYTYTYTPVTTALATAQTSPPPPLPTPSRPSLPSTPAVTNGTEETTWKTSNSNKRSTLKKLRNSNLWIPTRDVAWEEEEEEVPMTVNITINRSCMVLSK